MSLFQLDVLQMATGNVTKIQKIHLQVLPKYTPKQPLEMSQKINYPHYFKISCDFCHQKCHKKSEKIFSLFVPGSREFCHWKCHQKIQKNSFSLVVLDILDFCPWKCHKKFNQYSFSVFIPDNNFATENVTKILQEI